MLKPITNIWIEFSEKVMNVYIKVIYAKQPVKREDYLLWLDQDGIRKD